MAPLPCPPLTKQPQGRKTRGTVLRTCPGRVGVRTKGHHRSQRNTMDMALPIDERVGLLRHPLLDTLLRMEFNGNDLTPIDDLSDRSTILARRNHKLDGDAWRAIHGQRTHVPRETKSVNAETLQFQVGAASNPNCNQMTLYAKYFQVLGFNLYPIKDPTGHDFKTWSQAGHQERAGCGDPLETRGYTTMTYDVRG